MEEEGCRGRGLGEQRNANGFFGQHSRPSLELDCLDYIMDMFGDVKYGVCIHNWIQIFSDVIGSLKVRDDVYQNIRFDDKI